jgi:hypothetical protein
MRIDHASATRRAADISWYWLSIQIRCLAILSMAGRQDFVLVGKVEDLRRKVFELAALIGEPLVQDPGR